jgi:hypothetical protein
MLQFQLFRIKVYPSQQRHLFEADRTRSQMLRETVVSAPSADFRGGLTWHIGNVAEIDRSGLYFRLGRASRATLEIYDPRTHRFIDQEFETAPYTHVILDVDREVCAIAKKTRLASSALDIARRFGRLLDESEQARALRTSFEVNDIKDPEDFITQLSQAYSISKFWVTLSRPNAFDANEDFIKPFQRMVEAANGEMGKAELRGQNLNAQQLETVARSAAATGDDAVAWIKPTEGARRVRKQLRGNPANISQEDVADDRDRKELLDRLRELYRRIRGDDYHDH